MTKKQIQSKIIAKQNAVKKLTDKVISVRAEIAILKAAAKTAI
jgi:hypothetical protein